MAGVDDVRSSPPELSRRQVRHLLSLAMLRSLSIAVVLIAVYYVAPLRELKGLPVAVSLPIELAIFAVVVAWQVRAILRATYPGVRAVEGLAMTLPLFLVMFASAYCVLAQDAPGNFSTPSLTRTDLLYFTITVFSTVGFGDITATSETARVVVMLQMVLDVAIVGLGVRLLLGAVDVGRRRRTAERTKPDGGDVPRPSGEAPT